MVVGLGGWMPWCSPAASASTTPRSAAFVKPVAQPRADGGPDRSVARVTATTALRPPKPLSTAELESQLGAGGLDVAMEKIVAAWEPTYDSSDVVVVEGLRAGPGGCTPVR